MPKADTIDVTYVGTQTPYVDRIYRTGLSFMPGQVRDIPAGIAAKFLRHSDVFSRDAAAAAPDTGDQTGDQTDDTAALLAEAEKKAAEEREKEERLFAMNEQIEGMDKDAVRDFLDRNFQEKPHNAMGLPRLQDLAKNLVATRGLA